MFLIVIFLFMRGRFGERLLICTHMGWIHYFVLSEKHYPPALWSAVPSNTFLFNW